MGKRKTKLPEQPSSVSVEPLRRLLGGAGKDKSDAEVLEAWRYVQGLAELLPTLPQPLPWDDTVVRIPYRLQYLAEVENEVAGRDIKPGDVRRLDAKREINRLVASVRRRTLREIERRRTAGESMAVPHHDVHVRAYLDAVRGYVDDLRPGRI